MPCKPFELTAPAHVYRTRRTTLAAALTRPLVIMAGRSRARQYATNRYPFRAGSSYLYFGGPPIEGGAWLIEPGSDGDSGCTLFREVSGIDDAVWVGEAPSDELLAGAAGVDRKRLATPDRLTETIANREAGVVAPPCPPTLEWVRKCPMKPANKEELLAIIGLRLIKDEYELAAMRRAARVGVEAHLAAIRAAALGRRESDIAATLGAIYTANGCGHSFTPIVTVRGEVLHAAGFHHSLAAGRLVLIDAGAEEPGGYASDITRTIPTSGSFTRIQRQLYDTVLRANRAAVSACVPGSRFRDIHDDAARRICEGLVQAELLRGDPGDLFARGAHTLFFTHGLGHLLGLDVHDMEDFGDLAGYAQGRVRRPEFGNKFLRLDRDLAAGMTLTIEPGIYLVPAIWRNEELTAPFADVVNRKLVDELLRGSFGGIRIEDDVHVRQKDAGGPEVLTRALPSDADAIAALVNSTGAPGQSGGGRRNAHGVPVSD